MKQQQRHFVPASCPRSLNTSALSSSGVISSTDFAAGAAAGAGAAAAAATLDTLRTGKPGPGPALAAAAEMSEPPKADRVENLVNKRFSHL